MCPFKPLFLRGHSKVSCSLITVYHTVFTQKCNSALIKFSRLKCCAYLRVAFISMLDVTKNYFNYLEMLFWQHSYHLKTEWCRRLSTAPQHSATNHPFKNGDWDWQHDSLSRHIGHKRFRTTPHYNCLQENYAHWSALVLWLTPPSSVQRGVA